MQASSKTWRYDLDEDKFVKIEIEDSMIKWTIDIIENPEAHFKAEDDRRFGVYTYNHQSFLGFIVRPWLDTISEEMHKEISDYLKVNYVIEDFEKSYREVLSQRTSYWEPTEDKLIYEGSSELGIQRFYNTDKGILVIHAALIDPLDRQRTQYVVSRESILNQKDLYPTQVVEYLKKIDD